MIIYGKSCWNRIHFKFSPFDARNVSPYLKHTGMYCVCINWGNFRLSEILVCLFFAFHKGDELGQLLIKAKLSQNKMYIAMCWSTPQLMCILLCVDLHLSNGYYFFIFCFQIVY